MPFDAEDLARTALVRILPRSRYRLAAPTDARFAEFARDTVRITYRQQGPQPSFLLFVGPGQDPCAAAIGAARYAAANWTPNAIQRRVEPGVVAVQVAPAGQLAAAGPVDGAAVPAAVWTVDADTGRTDIRGSVPGAPNPGEIRRAAETLARGMPPPSLGELDLAERELLHPSSGTMPPIVSGGVAIVIVLFALRFGFGAFNGVSGYGRALLTAGANLGPRLFAVALAGLIGNALLLAGILLGVGVLLNVGNLAYRAPGFRSTHSRTRTLTWTVFAVVMAGLAIGVNYVLPTAARPSG